MSDLIERETVLAFVHRCKDRLQGKGLTYDMLVDYVESIPSAERKGEWIDRTYGGRILHPWWESCECSQCEEWGSGAWNYCPNCGAKMKGADDD